SMTSSKDNEKQSFLFVISGAPLMKLTTSVPDVASNVREVYCPGCIEEDGISMVESPPLSWIGLASRTIQRIIDDLRKRAPRAIVTVVTLLGGIQTQLHCVPIQCEEQIEISLGSIEAMLVSEPSFTNNLHEYLTKMKMNSTSILKKSTSTPAGSKFDKMFMFMCEDDLTSKALHIGNTVSLAPLVRWFIIGPTRLYKSVESIKRRFAQKCDDFGILSSDDMVAGNLMNRLLPPPEKKPILAFGTKTAHFGIDRTSGVRSIEVLGFMPVGNVSTSNLSQFSFEPQFSYEIGQDPDYDETAPVTREYDIDGDYFSSFPDPEQQLLPLLLNGLAKESLAAFCQVSLKEGTEYLAVKQALASLQDSGKEEGPVNGMEIDEDGNVRGKEANSDEEMTHLPVYGVLFATSKNGYCYELPEDVQEVDPDEGPSDDDDIDDIIDEERGTSIRLTLALLSPVMDRPGWPEIEQWMSEVKPWDPNERLAFWETEKYETKSNRWMDDIVFAKEITLVLTNYAAKKDFVRLQAELSDLEQELAARCMSPDWINSVLDAVAEGVVDTATTNRVLALKKTPIVTIE
ncbi:hypothetical protein PMAYCL1PPCAC_20996, partial [Pristionchus mayeri]